MSGLHNMSLLFYSKKPEDQLSPVCLAALASAPDLNKQFIKICVHHPQNVNMSALVKLPPFVNRMKRENKIPVIAVAGFKKPIFAKDACSWLKEHVGNGGLTAVNITGNDEFADNCSTVEQAELLNSEYFNTEYNMGFADGSGETGKNYANITESSQNRIVCYKDDEDRSKASHAADAKLEQIRQQRNNDVPRPIQRIGRNPHQQGMPSMPSMPGRAPMSSMTGHIPSMPSRSGMPNIPGMPNRQDQGLGPGQQRFMPNFR